MLFPFFPLPSRPHVVSFPFGPFTAPWSSQFPLPPWMLRFPLHWKLTQPHLHFALPTGNSWPREIQARSRGAEKSADLPHHNGPAACVASPPLEPRAAHFHHHLHSFCSRCQGLWGPHSTVSTGSISHHGGFAVYVVRDLLAPCLLGLLLRLPQAAI